MDYQASSLSDLRFGAIDGLSSVLLGEGATDLASTIDITLAACCLLTLRQLAFRLFTKSFQ